MAIETHPAQVGDSKVDLIDRRRFAELMTDFDLGVTTMATNDVKREDSDSFDEE